MAPHSRNYFLQFVISVSAISLKISLPFTWLVNIPHILPPLPQHSYNSSNRPVLQNNSSQSSLGPTVLLSLLFPVKYGLNNVEHQHLGITLLRIAVVSIPRNEVITLDKSILYLQFISKMSDSPFVLVVHEIMFVIISVVNARKSTTLLLGRLRKWPIANSSEGKCDRCTFKKMQTPILFIIRSSCSMLRYREKAFIYNLLAYVLDKF